MAMAEYNQDTTLLYSINDVRAFQIRQGKEVSLTPSGPQTLNLTTSSGEQNNVTLRLRLSPDVDIPLLATTKVFSRPPRSYMIPPASFQDNVAAFTRIEFADTVPIDDVETFETILAQTTAFGRGGLRGTPGNTPSSSPARPPRPASGSARSSPAPPAKSATWGSPSTPAPRSSSSTPVKTRPAMDRKPTGQLVLVDEEDGNVMGQLGAGAEVIEDSKVSGSSKDTPVEIVISEDGKSVEVREASEDYLRESRDPRYANSALVQNAAKASRLIVTSSARFGNMLTSSAERYTQTTAPASKPLTFSPAAQETANQVHAFTKTGATFTAKTVEKIAGGVQNMVATLVEETKDAADDKSTMPSWVFEGVAALSTVMDGVAEGVKTVFSESGNAATMAVSHKYGAEAGQMATALGGGLRNVGLVYVGVTGIPRKAIIRGGRGALLGRVTDAHGNQADVLVGDSDSKMITDGKTSTDEKAIMDGDMLENMKLIDLVDDDEPERTPTRSRTMPRSGHE